MIITVERDGKEIEVEVDTEWQPAEPDVGIGAGLLVHPNATGPDGLAVTLTEAEMTKIAEDHEDDHADDADDYDED